MATNGMPYMNAQPGPQPVVPKMDWSPLAQLGQVYQQAEQRRTLADLGQQISAGNVDYNVAAGKALEAGNVQLATGLMTMGEAARKRKSGETIANGWAEQFNSPAPTAQPQGMPQQGMPAPMPQPNQATGISPQERGAMDYYTHPERGYSVPQASGIVGNFTAESQLDPKAVGDGGASFGVGQWNGPRKQALMQFAQERGADPSDPQTQYAFTHHELQTTERRAGGALTAANDPQAAATAFVGFERPQGYTAANPAGAMHYDRRVGNAQRLASAYGAPAPDTVPQGAPMPSTGLSENPVKPQGGMAHGGMAPASGGNVPRQQAPQYAQASGGAPAMPSSGLPDIPLSKLMRITAHPDTPDGVRDSAKIMLQSKLRNADLPEQQKNYILHRSQGGTETFTEWSRGNSASSRMQITNDLRGETEEAKALGKGAGERANATMAASGAASKSLANLSRIDSLLDRVDQGKIEPGVMTVSAWAKSFGMNDEVAKSIGLKPEQVGDAQSLGALVNEMVVGKIGAGGFPANNFSDADREFLVSTVQRLGNDPRANKIITQVGRLTAQRDIQKAKEWRAFRRNPANKGLGFDDFEMQWSDKIASDDLFGDLRKQADSIVGPGRRSGGNAAPAPRDIESEMRRRGLVR